MCSISLFQFVITKLHLFRLFLWLFKTLSDQRHVRRYGIVCYSCMTSNALTFISQCSALQHSACYEHNQTYIISMWQLCSHVIFFEKMKKRKTVGYTETECQTSLSFHFLGFFYYWFGSMRRKKCKCLASRWARNVSKWINNHFDDLRPSISIRRIDDVNSLLVNIVLNNNGASA